jgi:dynein heavy chain
MQGKTWIKNMEKKNLVITKLSSDSFRNNLEECLANGKALLIEDVGEELDPILDNVLAKNYVKIGTSLKVCWRKFGKKHSPFHRLSKFRYQELMTSRLNHLLTYRHLFLLQCKIADKECDINKDFRLYLTTKLANPSYRPEVAALTSLIDFTVTMKGLEDQLLNEVIVHEKSVSLKLKILLIRK